MSTNPWSLALHVLRFCAVLIAGSVLLFVCTVALQAIEFTYSLWEQRAPDTVRRVTTYLFTVFLSLMAFTVLAAIWVISA